MFEFNFGMVAVVGLLTLFAIFGEALRKAVDLHFVPWMMHRRGVESAKIQDYVLNQATNQRQNLLIQILNLLLQFFKK